MFCGDNRVGKTEHWLEEQEFDLVLLDIQLPDGDGLQLMKMFRKHSLMRQ